MAGRVRNARPAPGSPRPGRWHLAASVVVLAVLGGCAPAAPADDGLHVLTSFYPLQFVVERVGAGRVTVDNLTPPGADPHDLELSPAQVREVVDADLVVYLSGFQPSTDEAIASSGQQQVVDAAQSADLQEGDPHFWLDPERLATVGAQVVAALSAVDPAGAQQYADAGRLLERDLTELDARFAAALATCSGATLVTAHTAFGYLADRYGLEQVGIVGLDPEVEPSPVRLREVGDVVRDRGVRTLFFETSSSPKVTQLLADDLGVSSDVLDPAETQAHPDTDFLDVMDANLAALQRGLVCR